MRNFVMRVIINSLALWLVSAVFPNLIWFQTSGAGDYLIAGLVLGLANAVIRPILLLLTLPATILTLGLFTFVINAVILLVVAATTRLETGGFFAALLASLLLSVASSIISTVLGGEKGAEKKRSSH
jgi:putative membrane protein